jgi:3-dehydro-4-phosphotetronate decarboxylase
MNENAAREAICTVGQSLFKRGYVHATAGNISVALDDGFLITPTDACLGFLDPAQLAKLDLEGRQVSGARASKTIALHQTIYRHAVHFELTAKTACVIHTHSTHTVALSLKPQDAIVTDYGPELLPPLTPYFVMKVGHVPIIEYQRPGAPEVADAVALAIDQYGEKNRAIRAVMLPRLGPNVWHDSPMAAMATLEELEETARLYYLAKLRDMTEPPATLDSKAIAQLRSNFIISW